jgi:putative endonuclease
MAKSAEEYRRHNKEIGQLGEELAAEFLKKKGFVILERNFKVPLGEIDIVARDGDVLVFCEVKTREDEFFGPPECAVTAGKQKKIRKTAAAYFHMHGIEEQECRFDVVAIYLGNGTPEITLFLNAFYF